MLHTSIAVVCHLSHGRTALTTCLIDAVTVGGISFFSSLIALGYGDLFLNIKVGLFASITMGGLAFFQELRTWTAKKRRVYAGSASLRSTSPAD